MILEITAAAIGGGFVGYFACAVMKAAKVADLQAERDHAIDAKVADILPLANLEIAQQAADAQHAHTRCAAALITKQSRIDRALEQVTPGANATVLRVARILRGEA